MIKVPCRYEIITVVKHFVAKKETCLVKTRTISVNWRKKYRGYMHMGDKPVGSAGEHRPK